MAAAFIHYFLGIGVAYLFGYSGIEVLIIGLIGALQDIDAISFLFYRQITRSRAPELFMHRGITHTVLFTALVSGIVFFFHNKLGLIILVNFSLHIFTDYVTAWGISPFQPFSRQRYSLGLMTIYDIPLTGFSLLTALSGILSIDVVWAFTGFFGYIGLRFLLKRRLPHRDLLVPVGNFTYTFCIAEDDYTVGKIDILGRTTQISIPRTDSSIELKIMESVEVKIKGSMLSHFLEYPVYTLENGIIVIRDARHSLFPKSSRFRFEILFDNETGTLFMEIAGRRIDL
jgi:membrane-bound metal-dependent hydrolase YbcI (DUF457 family)